MRFSSKMIAGSNSILYVHFIEPGFLSVIKTNAFSPSQKNLTPTYNHDMIFHFSAPNSTGKIKSAAIIYHCSFFECITPLHIHPGENSSSVTQLYHFSIKLLVILGPFNPSYFTVSKEEEFEIL